MGDYRKLRVWQHARELCRRVAALVAELPPDVRRGLGDQLTRAATSIRLNIAEGAGVNSDAMFARHIRIALGSANECQDAVDEIGELNLLPEADRDIAEHIRQLRAMLAVFLRRLVPSRT